MRTDYRMWWRKWEEAQGACELIQEVCELMDGDLWIYYCKNFRLSSEVEVGCKCAQCDCIFEQLWAIRGGLAE